jgi:hypothetical protein
MIPEQMSTNAALAVWESVKDGTPGERHLCGVLEKGPHGLTRATVLIATVAAEGARAGYFSGVDSLTFENRKEARDFVTAWLRYRIFCRKRGCA